MEKGDAKTIKNVLTNVLESAETLDGIDSKLCDDIIAYAGKLDGKIKNPLALEIIRNFKVRALGAKVQTLRKDFPDKETAYNELLKAELRDILYGKYGKAGEVIINGTKDEINEEMLEVLAREISDVLISVTPGNTVFPGVDKALGRVRSRFSNNDLHKEISKETIDALLHKRKELKDRLKIQDTEYNYYEYYQKFYNGGGHKTAPNMDRNSAIDILNKYLGDGEKLAADSRLDDIKKTYRKLALQYHPDKCPDKSKKAQYQKIFQKVSNAYGSLKD